MDNKNIPLSADERKKHSVVKKKLKEHEGNHESFKPRLHTIDSNDTKITYYFLLPILLYIFRAALRTVAAIVDLFVPSLSFVFAINFLF